ncbi:glycosyltransferase family 4 protein [Methanosarcina mazei]|uniref:glycosyltransferase family 4 protein n=1 Tax=Methanosarcina mazei TaxID=2209 RepID=UPI001F47BFDF|nr:glycosyltransferase family 4 protein [Methanosarcina mazei]
MFGGVARVVYSLSHELSKQNCELILFRKKRYKNLFKKRACEKDENLDICDVSHVGLVMNLIRHKYDVINVHNMSSFFIIPFILKKLKIINSKVVFVSHGLVPIEKGNQMYNYPLRYFFYQRICLFWSDHVIAVSNYLKSSIINEYQIKETKISVVHNGVEDKFFAGEKVSFAGTSPYVLYVGTITKIKGLDFLLAAIQKIDNCRLVLIGKKTDYLNELEKKHSNLFESKKVMYIGEMDTKTLLSAYSNSTFFVLPSNYDSYPMVVLEAMASGKPVVISENMGSKEIIENGKEGFIVPFGDVDSLVYAISYLLNNEKVVEEMGLLAKQKALKNKWCIKVNEYVEIFEYINDGKVF